MTVSLPATAFLALVCCQRLAELGLARRNTRRLLARGGREVGAGHYRFIVAVHAGWVVAMIVFGHTAPVSLSWFGGYLGLQIARAWVIASLGGRWTTRIIVIDEAAVRRGPYRWLRHPNYLVVSAELAVAPMVLDLPMVALCFFALNLAVLRVRIGMEERALASPRLEPAGPEGHWGDKGSSRYAGRINAAFACRRHIDGWSWPAEGGDHLPHGPHEPRRPPIMESGPLMDSSPLSSPAEDMELLRSAAVSAGIIAAGFFRRDVRSWTKDNASPVTEADITVDHFLQDALLAARPGYGWLSEEAADSTARLAQSRVFVIDPIDGTRGFIRGDDSWTVSLAVVENGVPVAGVVYAPARDELFDAARGEGVRLNGRPLQRNAAPGRRPIIPAPGAVHQTLQSAGLDYKRGPAFASLAYRLVQVATGQLDAAVARRGAQDWDIAGAAMVLMEAGIGLEDVCAGTPRFNRAEVRHGALAVYAHACLRPYLSEALRSVYGCPDEANGTADVGSS